MGSQAHQYSDDQKAAITRAVIEKGLTAQEAVNKAAAGELDVPPFDVPLSTAQGFVTQARQTRPPGSGTAHFTRLRQIADRASALIEAELTKVEDGSGRGLDLPRMKRALQSAQHLARLEQLLAEPQARPAPTSTTPTTTRALERRMTQAARATSPEDTGDTMGRMLADLDADPPANYPMGQDDQREAATT